MARWEKGLEKIRRIQKDPMTGKKTYTERTKSEVYARALSAACSLTSMFDNRFDGWKKSCLRHYYTNLGLVEDLQR